MQATRQLLRKERRGKLRLSIKRAGIIEPSTAEIVEYRVFHTTRNDVRIIVAPNHDPSCATADQLGETIDQHKLRDVIGEMPQFQAINYHRMQWTQPANGLHRGIDGGAIRWVAA
jgi:hypothetical protein